MIEVPTHQCVVSVINVVSERRNLFVPDWLGRGIQISIDNAKREVGGIVRERDMLYVTFKSNVVSDGVVFDHFWSNNDQSAPSFFVVGRVDKKFVAGEEGINFSDELVTWNSYVLETDDIMRGDERTQKSDNFRKPASETPWGPNT